MLDIAVLYNKYKFLGHEFLTWLWFTLENDPERLKDDEGMPVQLTVGNRIVLEVIREESTVESVTIKGDNADLSEGIVAIRKGALVTEISLAYKKGDLGWSFTLKGENFNITGLKTPETPPVESGDETEGAVIDKLFLSREVVDLTGGLFRDFVRLRISEAWKKETVPAIKGWLTA
ncbi:hypothetical protein [Desulfoluna butyratoxydans]|uniref:Uncharacterized protein n=1 Tax=Desulfoluna butyratoxydans TaxID=231438 RepID=A0A4U8YK95_9BACT|nr:hypothetical protein [Desulfoluna butyratoxydans]VFQ43784.1 hypothetical protein MSL71_14250 [Desulfoluna butyratoxydans]